MGVDKDTLDTTSKLLKTTGYDIAQLMKSGF